MLNGLCCINQYKNTNLKANHNYRPHFVFESRAVSTNTKIQIWKQITTANVIHNAVDWLYQPIQKYKFESKSQPWAAECHRVEGCINQYKNTNLKANHNCSFAPMWYAAAVSTNTKIQIWKQITTKGEFIFEADQLYQPIQKYKFESKSQPVGATEIKFVGCINQYKNTNLKANHNLRFCFCFPPGAVSTNTKIQIWKQITTRGCAGCQHPWLYQPIQKYKFESKSQQGKGVQRHATGCINQYKNTNLKANHNRADRDIMIK